MDISSAGRASLLIVLANSAAWASGRMLRGRFATPMDFGWVLWDGNRLFGSHKTWRGMIVGVLTCALAGQVLGPSWMIGAGCGALSLLGDAFSSALKRRLQLPPGSEVLGLDQLPEALLPLIVFAPSLNLGIVEVAIAAGSFTILDILVTQLRRASYAR